MVSSINLIISDENKNAVEKINSYFGMIVNWKIENWELTLSYIKQAVKHNNNIFFQIFMENIVEKILPTIIPLAKQGIEEGYFKTDYPEIAIETCIRTFSAIADQLSIKILKSGTKKEALEQYFIMISFYEDLIGRILGADKDLIKIIDQDNFRKIYDSIPPEYKEI